VHIERSKNNMRNQMISQRGTVVSHDRVHFAAMAELYEFDDYGRGDCPNMWYTVSLFVGMQL
jgi:hypothetical protein